MILNDVVSTNSSFGVRALGGSRVSLSNSQIVGNETAASANTGGLGYSYGNNRVFGNTNNTLANFTPIAEQ